MQEEFQIKITTPIDASGLDQLKTRFSEAEGNMRKFGAAFDQAFGELKNGLLSRVLPPGERAALSQALDQLKGQLSSTFDAADGDAAKFAGAVEEIKAQMLEAAQVSKEWKPEEDAQQVVQLGGAVQQTGEQIKITNTHVKAAAGLAANMAVSMAGGVSPASALTGALSQLAFLGGPLVGGVVTALGLLVNKLIESKSAADALDLKKLADGAKQAEQYFKAAAAAAREEFGAALEDLKRQSDEFLTSWSAATASVSKGYDRQGKEADAAGAIEDAALNAEEQAALANAKPEDREQIKKDYADMRYQNQRRRKFEGMDRDINEAEQKIGLAEQGIAAGEAEMQAGAGDVKAAQEARNAARNRMTKSGVRSDQDRILDEWSSLGQKEIAGQELSENEKTRREQLRVQVDQARADRQAGRFTYDVAGADENLGLEQKDALARGQREMGEADAAEAAGRERIERGSKAKATAGEALATARGDFQTMRTRQEAEKSEMERIDIARTEAAAAPSSSSGEAEAMGGVEKAVTSSGNEEKQAINNVAEAVQTSGSTTAGEMQKLGSTMSGALGDISKAISTLASQMQQMRSEINAASNRAAAAASSARDNERRTRRL